MKRMQKAMLSMLAAEVSQASQAAFRGSEYPITPRMQLRMMRDLERSMGTGDAVEAPVLEKPVRQIPRVDRRGR